MVRLRNELLLVPDCLPLYVRAALCVTCPGVLAGSSWSRAREGRRMEAEEAKRPNKVIISLEEAEAFKGDIDKLASNNHQQQLWREASARRREKQRAESQVSSTL
jgi:hypothetical protein